MVKYFDLFLTFFKLDLKAKYSNASSWFFWLVINPLILVFIYTFVFHNLLGIKWEGQIVSSTKIGYSWIMLSGFAIYSAVAEILSKCVGLIKSNKAFIKKINFDVRLLPCAAALTSLMTFVLMLIVILFYSALFLELHDIRWIEIIILVFVLYIFLLGLSFFASAFLFYFDDSSQYVSLLNQGLIFCSPVFYSIAAIPNSYQSLVNLNPITSFIGLLRNSLFGNDYGAYSLMTTSIISAVTLIIGYLFFEKLKIGFNDE